MPAFHHALPLILLLLGSAPLPAQQTPAPQTPAPQPLRLQFPAGTTLHYVATTELATIVLLPRELRTALRIEVWFDLAIGAPAAAGKTHVTAAVKRLKLALDNRPLSQIDYDSDREGSDPGMLREMTILLGKSFAMQMDARGHLGDAVLPKDFPKSAVQLFGGDIGQFFADNFPELPEATVAAGARWQGVTAMPLQQSGSVSITVDNQLESLDGQRAVVAQTLQVDAANLDLPKGTKLEVTRADGRYELDLQVGCVRSATTTMDVQTTGRQDDMPLDLQQHLVRTLQLRAVDPQAAEAPK